MSIVFQVTFNGITVEKRLACMETLGDFAYIMFSHAFFFQGRVSLSILVTGLDGRLLPVYNIADAKIQNCFLNARGEPEIGIQSCRVIMAVLHRDQNGNLELSTAIVNK